jgi:hypothetical protein
MSKERVQIRDTSGEGVTLSATVKESHRYAMDNTQHAVEKGSPISDNSRRRLAVVSLEGLVSDLPGGGETVSGEPSQDAVLFFIGLRNNPRVVELVTPRIVYDAVKLGNCEIPRKNSDGKAARFNIEFIEHEEVNLTKVVVQVKLGQKAKKGRQENKFSLPAPVQSAGVIIYDKLKGAGGVAGYLGGWLGRK